MAQDTLAAKVRAKFPGVYDDLDDATLERNVRAKFPGVYDDLPTTDAAASKPVPAAERTWTDTLRDSVGGVRAGVATTVFGGGDLIRRATGMERIVDQPEVRAAMTPPDSTAGRVAMTAEQIGEFFLPTGVVGKAAKVAEVVKAGALTAAQTGGSPTATALSAGLTAVLPGGAPLQKASTALRASAVETMANSLRATKEWAKAEAERLAPEMLRRGVHGSIKTLRETSAKMAEKAGTNLAAAYTAAAAAGETVPGMIVRGNIQLASDALHTVAANGRRLAVPGNEAAIKQLEALEAFVGKLKPDIPVDQAAAIKSQFDDIVERAGLFGPKAMASAREKAQGWSFKQASDTFRRMLNTNPTIADLNAEASFWIGLRKVSEATKLRRVGQSGGLIPSIAAMSGAAVGASAGGPIGALVGTVTAHKLARVLQSPAWLNTVSAPMKDALATALASGSATRIAGAINRTIASLPAELRQSLGAQ
jgi:hypothetical protein